MVKRIFLTIYTQRSMTSIWHKPIGKWRKGMTLHIKGCWIGCENLK